MKHDKRFGHNHCDTLVFAMLKIYPLGKKNLTKINKQIIFYLRGKEMRNQIGSYLQNAKAGKGIQGVRFYRLIFTLKGDALEIAHIEEVSKHYGD